MTNHSRKYKDNCHEEPYIERIRRLIKEQYKQQPTGCGDSFGELLCYELHVNDLDFKQLAKKWSIPLTTLGELVHDHCKRLENDPTVDFGLVMKTPKTSS